MLSIDNTCHLVTNSGDSYEIRTVVDSISVACFISEEKTKNQNVKFEAISLKRNDSVIKASKLRSNLARSSLTP